MAGNTVVVLVHFGDPSITSGCLRNLVEIEETPHRVVVVDHGPGIGLREALEGLHPGLTVLANHANPGFGAGCNLGASIAFKEGAEAVWFLNNDARLKSPLLETFLAQSRQNPQVALWGTHQRDGARLFGCDLQPPWYAQDLPECNAERLKGGRYIAPQESLSGASIFITRASWEKLGPWPDSFFLYFEDSAWCRRAHECGLPMVLLDDEVLHSAGTTTGRKSPSTIFYGTRNRLRLKSAIPGSSRFGVLLEAIYLFQRRLFRGQLSALKPVLDGCIAGIMGQEGRNPRY